MCKGLKIIAAGPYQSDPNCKGLLQVRPGLDGPKSQPFGEKKARPKARFAFGMRTGYGIVSPERPFVRRMSEAVIAPLTSTSARKFVPSVACPANPFTDVRSVPSTLRELL